MKKSMWSKQRKTSSLPFSPFSPEGRIGNAIYLKKCPECDSKIEVIPDVNPNYTGPAHYGCLKCSWEAIEGADRYLSFGDE